MTKLLPQKVLLATPVNFRTVEELYSLYGRQAFGLALRVLEDSAAAEQAVHEIFVRYWRQPGVYNPQNGPFLNWLLREVHCYCLDQLPEGQNQVKNSRVGTGPLSTQNLFKKAASPKEDTITRQQAQARQTLAGLPEEQREMVELAYFKGLNHRQIAQATGQSVPTVRRNLAIGLLRLKAQLDRV